MLEDNIPDFIREKKSEYRIERDEITNVFRGIVFAAIITVIICLMQ